MARPVHDYGERALLVECGSIGEVLALAETVRAAGLAGITDIGPGARTVLVRLTGRDVAGRIRATLETVDAADPGTVDARRPDVVIDVVYDGADLGEVAQRLHMRADEVVAAHTGGVWRVGFGGFAPGFAYLVGGDPRLAVPRRAEPRTRVPAGAVGLAGEFSGIYPRESPGGWQLIGRTDAVLWDVHRPRPALLTPGMTVRFRDVGRP